MNENIWLVTKLIIGKVLVKSSSSYMLYYFYIQDLGSNWYKNFVDTKKLKEEI